MSGPGYEWTRDLNGERLYPGSNSWVMVVPPSHGHASTLTERLPGVPPDLERGPRHRDLQDGVAVDDVPRSGRPVVGEQIQSIDGPGGHGDLRAVGRGRLHPERGRGHARQDLPAEVQEV